MILAYFVCGALTLYENTNVSLVYWLYLTVFKKGETTNFFIINWPVFIIEPVVFVTARHVRAILLISIIG
jgi:hypothetical protein